MSQQPPAPRPPGRSPDTFIAWGLAALTLALYLPGLSNGFVDYDDPQYVTDTPIVQRGLTIEGVKWAFTTNRMANWIPLTWLSHMLDCQWFGLNAGGHHFTSAALHAANAALVFLVLRSMTGSRWRPAAAALLFAAHPLRVESVAWVSERKDVLCATFFLLALLAWAHYCRRPSAGRFGLVVLLDALGLMAKSMLVTFPFVLLLLDYWPLRRVRLGDRSDETDVEKSPFPPRPLGWLLLEKLPFFALSAAISVVTYFVQRGSGAMVGAGHLTLGERLANAVVSVARYLGKTFWPVELSVFYPHPGRWPASYVAGAVLLLAVVTGATLWQLRRRPYLAVGWFWFVGMLVPVSGVVQVGVQSMADRYTYLPSIGLTFALVWLAAEMLIRFRAGRVIGAAVTTALAVALSIGTVLQQRHWTGTVSLFEHALALDANNWIAHSMLGVVRHGRGDDAGAIRHYERAIQINPRHPDAWHNYGLSLDSLGRYDEAIEYYRRALALQQPPGTPRTHFVLGLTLAEKGRLDEAADEFRQSAELAPKVADTWLAWGIALQRLGRRDEAADKFRQVLRLIPDHPAAVAGLEQLATQPATQPATGPATHPVTRPER